VRRPRVDPQGRHVEGDRLLNGVEGAADGVGQAAVPDREQEVGLVEHHPTGLTVGFVGALAAAVELEGGQGAGLFGLGQDGVEAGGRPFLERVRAGEVAFKFIAMEGHDAVEPIAEAQGLLGEQAIRALGQRRDGGEQRRQVRIVEAPLRAGGEFADRPGHGLQRLGDAFADGDQGRLAFRQPVRAVTDHADAKGDAGARRRSLGGGSTHPSPLCVAH
jgi:hypothetical protein